MRFVGAALRGRPLLPDNKAGERCVRPLGSPPTSVGGEKGGSSSAEQGQSSPPCRNLLLFVILVTARSLASRAGVQNLSSARGSLHRQAEPAYSSDATTGGLRPSTHYLSSTIFLVCAISPASSRHRYNPDGKAEAPNVSRCRPAAWISFTRTATSRPNTS